jgi:eukaryotic-like serine/threonine-protein kinase
VAASLHPGDRVASYEVLGELGAGGMGEVYRAWDTRLEREVALKVLPAEVAEDPERLARFDREARLLAALDHPRIVRVHAVEETAGGRVIVMELVAGESLDRQIPPGGLPLQRFLPLALAVTDAVAAAHARGITHRDLKPGNVIVRPDGDVKVLDFGLAHRPTAISGTRGHELPTEVLTREGTLVGTAPYMSPEQVRGQPADPRSDVFALGATFYELLTGRRPFRGEDLMSLASAILRDAPPPPSSARADLPLALDAILARCLEKDPAARFASARELHDALTEIARELTPVAEPAPAASSTGSAAAGGRRRLRVAAAAGLLVTAVALGLLWRRSQPGAATTAGGNSRIDSLAVLPLANLSGDPAQEYFVDGLTEALIHDLAGIGALKVISRTSVMRFKGASRPLPEIARELGVRSVLEGSVLVDAEQMRISVKLVDAERDETLWAGRFDRPRRAVLALQAEVARAVAGEIQARLTPEESRRLAVARSVDPAAHELLLRGRYLWNRRTAESLAQAIAAFEQALAVDPGLAEAWAGIALCRVIISAQGIGGDEPPAASTARAKDAARRALALDSSQAEAHAALAYAVMLGDWDWAEAERGFARAIELNPGLSIAHFWRAALFAAQNRKAEALASAQRARELDPVSPLMGSGLSWIHHLAHRHDEAATEAERVLAFEPHFPLVRYRLGFAHSLRGRFAEALPEFQLAYELSGESPDMLAFLGYGYGRAGRRREAEEIAARLAALARERYVSAFSRALVRIGLGDHDGALDWLEHAVEERSWYVPFFAVDPTLVPLRGEPRFGEILRRVGLAHAPPLS